MGFVGWGRMSNSRRKSRDCLFLVVDANGTNPYLAPHVTLLTQDTTSYPP